VKAHRVLFALASLCLGSASAVLAAPSDQDYSRHDAERYIQESEAAWASSVATNDASVVRRILADDLVWVLDGRVLGKAQAVAEAEKGPYDFVSNHLEYAHVRFFGDTAVFKEAKNGLAAAERPDGSCGPTPGCNETDNGRLLRRKMSLCQSKNSVRCQNGRWRGA
jgi:ketosteroid isomerase-like protein